MTAITDTTDSGNGTNETRLPTFTEAHARALADLDPNTIPVFDPTHFDLPPLDK